MVLLGRLGLETARIPHVDRHGLVWLERGALYVEDGTLRFKAAGSPSLVAGDYALPFQTLSLVLLGSVIYITGPALEAMDRQMSSVIIYALALGAVAVVGYWAIPRYGIEGAAWALVVGATLRFGIESALVFTLLKLRYPTPWVVKTVVASVTMAVIGLLVLGSCHFLVVMLLVAPLVYLLAQTALRTLAREDWEYVQRFMPKQTERLWSLLARFQRVA